jgi:hypothetical protein
MMMDNRQFNINGQGKEMLQRTIRLAFEQEGQRTTAKAYVIDPDKGLVLLWHPVKETMPFPAHFNADAATEFIWAWLQSEPKMEHTDWDADLDHDGHNSMGWRVYCEDWGHVQLGPRHSTKEASHYAIVAVKPAYLWHGK